ncbi:MAG: nucleoside deaminase [Ruminococcaceae bacterium]|nr:nucleoside deaminase [Oscillospiraceae bacterium]
MYKFTAGEILPDELIEEYMNIAIDEAFGSADSLTDKSAEIPVGCIIVDSEGNVVARSHNTRRHTHSVTGHAEINAIEEFTSKTGNYRLCGATIFVTLEPCPMCAGALAAAKPDAVYYGAPNTENGSCGTVFNILNSHTKIYGGIKSNEISAKMSDFFVKIRKTIATNNNT